MDYFEFNIADFKRDLDNPPALHLESRPVAVNYRYVQRHRLSAISIGNLQLIRFAIAARQWPNGTYTAPSVDSG